MSAQFSPRSPAPPGGLAELLVSAAEHLSATPRSLDLTPAGVPVRDGRLSLARLSSELPAGEWLEVAAGFATACWIGPTGVRAPDMGRLAYRSRTRVDDRGRLSLDRRTRTWLAVGDLNRFDVVVVPAPDGGLLVVPVEDFARRWVVLAR